MNIDKYIKLLEIRRRANELIKKYELELQEQPELQQARGRERLGRTGSGTGNIFQKKLDK